ncbi:hypothetical protein dsx2_2518 [Desulfovibrio sp. X2]|uniref:DUF5420 family protein n=1 Tax=Desulfovibrio sp. X2 TaxID=941449 RepID=UPI000358E956|nr:DUF5420 family protein [Desulfovibrio sp. X2]EPR43158.1 hypothetical protein dsx2_2518 [Desulfovibrio sp. X2]
MQSKFYIGEGDEAAKLIASLDQALASFSKAREETCSVFGFDGVLSRELPLGGVTVVGFWTKDDIEVGQRTSRGVLPQSMSGDGHGWRPDMRTKTGKILKAALTELNDKTVDYSVYLTRSLGIGFHAAFNGRLYISVAGAVGGKVLAKVPQRDYSDTTAPTPPQWMREVKESEFLAAQGR